MLIAVRRSEAVTDAGGWSWFSITPEVNLTLSIIKTRRNKIPKKNYFGIPIRASFLFHRVIKKIVIFSSMLFSQY